MTNFFKDSLKHHYNENYLLLKESFNAICIYDFLDALVAMEKAMKRDNIKVNDRQLACAKIYSQEGQDYLKGMAAAANYAWVNRSSMTFLCRQVLRFLYYLLSTNFCRL